MIERIKEVLANILAFIDPEAEKPAAGAPVQHSAPMAVHQAGQWLSLEQFRKATGLSAVRAQDWHAHVRLACLEFDIASPARIAAFLAQVGHESGGFCYTREIWGPTAAQLRYEGRADLGNTQPGDGSRFRGRGLIQITGRANYGAVAHGLGINCVNDPALLEQPRNAARSAAWWWTNNGCNLIADTGDFERLTRRINGGLNGFDDRLARWKTAQYALTGQSGVIKA